MDVIELVRNIMSLGTFGFSIYVAVYLLTRTTVAFEKLTDILSRLEEKISIIDNKLDNIQTTIIMHERK